MREIISDLFELTKPKLTLLVLITAAIGLLLAPVEVHFIYSALFMVSLAALVGGACALNCYMESEVDKQMNRTKGRAIPSGRLSPLVALNFGLFLTMSGAFFIYRLSNPITCFLAVVAALMYLFAYTPMKKVSHWSLFIGAIPGALPPVLGWTMATGNIDPMAWVLFALMFVWQLPHFLAISIYHDKDYKTAQIKTLPQDRGINFTRHSIVFYTIILVLVSLLPIQVSSKGSTYLFFVLGLGLMFLFLAFQGTSIPLGAQSLSMRFHQWARRYFLASIIYLPLALGALLFLK